MPYLRVECFICGAIWNYYSEKWELYPTHTAVDYQGCVCPNCCAVGYIYGSASDKLVE